MLCIMTLQLQWLTSDQPQGLLLVFLSLVGEPPHAGLRAEEEGQAGGRTQWLVRVLLQDEF